MNEVNELRNILQQLAKLKPFKYREELRTFERKVEAGSLTAADVHNDLENLRPLATYLVRIYRAMTRGRGTLV